MAAPIFSAALRVIAGRLFGSAAAGSAASGVSMGNAASEMGDIAKNISKSVDDGAKEAVEQGAKILHAEVINSIKEANLVASGGLINSVRVSTMQSSSEQFSINVGSSSPYARFVEQGRAAGKQPPVDSILNWMIQKGIEPDARAAYLIARKIGKDGIAPKKVFEKAIEKTRPQVELLAPAVIHNKVTK